MKFTFHGRILVRAGLTQTHAELEVADTGIGISESELPRVFERFHRTDTGRTRAGGGAGLGLAIVRAIAEAHKGSVRVRDTRDGRGAAIELVLPGFEPS